MDRICQRALATKADDRYSSAEEFRADIESFLADTGHLVDARRKLAPSISALFADKRDEIRMVIEKQLAALDEKASGEFEAVAIPADSNASSLSLPSSNSSGSLDVTTTGVTNQKTEIYDPKKRRSAFNVAARVLLAASVAGVIGLSGLLISRRTVSQPAPAPSPSPAMVMLKVNATPSHARVIVDDGPPRAVPVDVSVPKDDAVHHLKIEADGFIGRTEPVSFASDVAMTLDLRPAEKVAAPSETGKKKTPPPPVVTIVKTVQAAPAKPTAEPASAPSSAASPAGTPTVAATGAPTGSAHDPKHVQPPRIDKGDPWATTK
jgi:hypothetical protein